MASRSRGLWGAGPPSERASFSMTSLRSQYEAVLVTVTPETLRSGRGGGLSAAFACEVPAEHAGRHSLSFGLLPTK